MGFAAILLQKEPSGKFHPVFYFSKRTTKAESKYHSFELEALCIVYSLERFRIYLQGLEFTIITDCNSLKLTLEKKEVNHRILRWSLALQNYNYKLIHRKAERMRHVDALSRSINILVESSFERNLGILQDKDPVITKIRDKLLRHEQPFYELRDGMVYRKANGKLLFYVPRAMITNVIQTCHDDVGHVGTDKTTELVSRTYWFPKMRAIVRQHIEKCLKCIAFSPNSGKIEGKLHSIAKGQLPFETLHVDHYGPLEKTNNGLRYIFAVIDAFSKFIKLYPCKTTSEFES